MKLAAHIVSLLTLGCLLLGVPLEAKSKRKAKPRIPILVASSQKLAKARVRRKFSSTRSVRQTRRKKPKPKNPWGIGFELGTIGRRNNSNADFLGLQYLLGFRLSSYLPIAKRFALKPSLGYFWRAEGTDLVKVRQNNFEAGANLYYITSPKSRTSGLIGLANKLDLRTSNVSVNGSGVSADPALIYRFGPVAGFASHLGGKTRLLMELELTFDYLQRRLRPYGGLNIGLQFSPG